MSYSLAVVRPAYGVEAVQRASEQLISTKLKGAKQFLFTDRKFDGRGLFRVRNMDGDYSADLLALRNVSLMAGRSGLSMDYYRDGYDMLCLKQAIQKEACDCFVLLRDQCDISSADIEWLQRNDREPWRTVGVPGLRETYIFDCRLTLAREAVSLAVNCYQSGAALSLSVPSLSQVLRVIVEGLSSTNALEDPLPP